MSSISGYWVTGHEYSVLYSDLKSIPSGYDSSATWLSVSGTVSKSVGIAPDGRRHVYEVSFVGVISKRHGFYGNGGFNSGAYVKRFLSIREIHGPGEA
jgi:hypothetical protein